MSEQRLFSKHRRTPLADLQRNRSRFAVLLVLLVLTAACGPRVDGPATMAGGDEDQAGGGGGSGSFEEGAVAEDSGPFAESGPADGAPADGAPTGGASSGTAAADAANSAGSPSGNGDEGTGAKVPAKGQGISDSTIKIGASFPLSGAFGSFGEEAAGALDSYIKLVNARGGVGGRQLQLISYDDQFDPQQMVANVKRLWEEEKVFIVFVFLGDAPLDYVRANNIPYFTFGAAPGAFTSNAPTAIPIGASMLSYSLQTDIALVEHMNIRPKKVALMYDDSPLLNGGGYVKYWIEAWKKLGAEEVVADPVTLSTGDCSSLVLKYRQMGIEYWDWASFGWLVCWSAMERLGWKPPLGHGGAVVGPPPLAKLAGPNIAGTVTGAPNDLVSGAPRFNEPQAAHKEYRKAIATYHPDLAKDDHLNSTIMANFFLGIKYVVAALDGAAKQSKELTQDSLFKWVYSTKNWDSGLSTPLKGHSPTCKEGTGTAWWGKWVWDAEKKELKKPPLSPYTNASWFFDDRCYETRIADEILGVK